MSNLVKPSINKKIGRRPVTVCIAALAENSKAIVLVSDKALTIGWLQDDTDIQKIIPVGNTGWMTLISGRVSRCNTVIRRVEEAINNDTNISKTPSKIAMYFGQKYREYRDELIDETILAPFRLTSDLWAKRNQSLLPLSDKLAYEIQTNMREFNVECELIICGFDEYKKANIIKVGHPGISYNVTNEGFCVIGSGHETAIGRLLWQKWTRKDNLQEVIYEVFDAKAHSELIHGVGTSWDGYVIRYGLKPKKIPSKIKVPVEKLFGILQMLPIGIKGGIIGKWSDMIINRCQDTFKIKRR